MKDKKILVVVAHPDDETLGCGGSMARWSKEGAIVKAVILSEGVTTSRYGSEKYAELKAEQKQHMEAAGAVLGADIYCIDRYEGLTGFKDNQFDSTPLLEVIKAVSVIVNEFKPDIVLTHFWDDLNVDHRVTFEAVQVACRPIYSPVKRLMCFETLSSTEWNFKSTKQFIPNTYVKLLDIHSILKAEALGCYKYEVMNYPHPRSLKGVVNNTASVGNQICENHAERFYTLFDIV